jgi:tRNA nucleotidyltransferase (CCA-adding enzyme)
VSRWELYSHGADVGIRGFGGKASEAFEAVALALTAAVCDPSRVFPNHRVDIQCEAPELEALLYEWVNSLVYEMATRRMLFSRFNVSVIGDKLTGTLGGESVDVAKHQPAVEVKGATYTELKVFQNAQGEWVAQCVVDV